MEPTANQTPTFPPQVASNPSMPTTPSISPAPQSAISQPSQAPNIPTPPSDEAVVTHSNGGNKGKIIVFVAIAILILVLALGATAFLLMNNKNSNNTNQISCTDYSYTIDKDGVVSIVNNGVSAVPAQTAIVVIDSVEYPSLDYPEIAPGQSIAVGEVTVPTDGSFAWQITDPQGCSSSGEYLAEVIAQCREIIVYNEDWEEILPSQLSELLEGDVLRFVVSSTTQNGIISKTRFTINGELMPETTLLRPGTTNEYYEEYEIAEGISNIVVNAELFHSDLGWF